VSWPEFLRTYIEACKVRPTYLYEHCYPANNDGLSAEGWDRHGYYNNFFISRVDWWLQPQVQSFINAVDE
jgi:hypothetical protein